MTSNSFIRRTPGDRTASLADTESRENMMQQIVGRRPARDLLERIARGSELEHDDLLGGTRPSGGTRSADGGGGVTEQRDVPDIRDGRWITPLVAIGQAAHNLTSKVDQPFTRVSRNGHDSYLRQLEP